MSTTTPTKLSKKITASDGHVIHSLLFSCESRRIVILAHGITAEKTEDGIFEKFATKFLAPDFDAICFDFRGHGESSIPPRDTTIAGELLDLMAVLKWCEDAGYRRIGIVGTSFGGSISLLAIQSFGQASISALALWNPVINYRNTFTHATTPWGKTFFTQSDDRDLANVTSIAIPETDFKIGPKMIMEFLLLHPEQTVIPDSIPTLVIHGTADTLVPHQDSKSFCSARRGIEFLSLPNVDHGFDDSISVAYTETAEWFRRHLKP